jgi:hypothetical protein
MQALPVLRELRTVLTETRQPPGREAVATFSEVAGKLKRNDNVVRKFEKGQSAPKFEEVDALVAAYSDATGVSIFDLWSAAIKRAKEAPPLTLADLATGALQDADTAGRATQKASRQSPSSRRPKATKRQAG